MSECTDRKYEYSKGEVVIKNEKLQLKVSYDYKDYCNCHPETCSHWGGSITKTSYNHYIISEESIKEIDPKVGERHKYKKKDWITVDLVLNN